MKKSTLYVEVMDSSPTQADVPHRWVQSQDSVCEIFDRQLWTGSRFFLSISVSFCQSPFYRSLTYIQHCPSGAQQAPSDRHDSPFLQLIFQKYPFCTRCQFSCYRFLCRHHLIMFRRQGKQKQPTYTCLEFTYFVHKQYLEMNSFQ
jgi:hypothetical protein